MAIRTLKLAPLAILVVTLIGFYLWTVKKDKFTHAVKMEKITTQTGKVVEAKNVGMNSVRKRRVYLTNTTAHLKPWQALALLEWDSHHPATNSIECKKIQKFGNYPICMDEPFKIKPPCLVYSFGINKDFSFDDAFGELGCEVHSFDPSMLDVEDHQRSKNVFFHRLGLTGSDESGFVPRKDQYIRKKQTWEVRMLNTIKKMLGHTNRKIDVLKIDIESYEWDALENFYEENILDNITQFLFEWHLFYNRPKKSEVPRMYQLYEYLSVIGFRSYYKKRTYGTSKPDLSLFYAQADTCWVNAKLKHKI